MALLLALPASGASTRAAEEPRKAIRDLLRRRAAAILERDRDAFLATLDDPRSAFGRRQAALFGNLATVPFASYRLQPIWSIYGDLARPSDLRRHDADRVSIPFTRERFRLKGFDRRAVHHDAYFTFVERDGEWRIASDSDLDGLGLFTQRSLWDFDPLTVRRSRHFLAVAARCCTPDMDRMLSTAEQALRRVDRYWDRDWDRMVPLMIPVSTDDLSGILQATYPVENYIAFAFWTGGAGGSAGARVIINPERFSGDGSLRSFEILTHELFHVASLPHSGPFVPNWLDEGMAQYVQFAGDRVDSYTAAVTSSGEAHAPDDYEFFVGDQTQIFRHYQRSLSLVGYIVERWGFDRLESLYVRLGEAGDEAGLGSFHIDGALRDELGMGLEDLEREWASSIGAS